MWLSWLLGTWALISFLFCYTSSILIRSLVSVCLPREAPSPMDRQKDEWNALFERQKLLSFSSLCAILAEFDGDSSEPEVHWLATWSTCSNLAALKPEVFQVLTEVCCGMQMYDGRLVPMCLFWSWSFAGAGIGFNTPLGLPFGTLLMGEWSMRLVTVLSWGFTTEWIRPCDGPCT